MKPMSEMREFAVSLAEALDQIGAAFRQDHGEIPMSAHLVRFPASGRPEVIHLDVSTGKYGETKEEMGRNVRAMSVKWGARYVILQNEAWVSFSEEGDEAEAVQAWVGAGQSLEHYPNRKEMMMVSADGPDLDIIIHREISPDGTIGEPQRMENSVSAGTLTNLSGRSVSEFPDAIN
jgi:hypothetical protein